MQGIGRRQKERREGGDMKIGITRGESGDMIHDT